MHWRVSAGAPDFADFKLGGPPRETPRTLGLADILDAADRGLRRRYVYLPPPAGM